MKHSIPITIIILSFLFACNSSQVQPGQPILTCLINGQPFTGTPTDIATVYSREITPTTVDSTEALVMFWQSPSADTVINFWVSDDPPKDSVNMCLGTSSPYLVPVPPPPSPSNPFGDTIGATIIFAFTKGFGIYGNNTQILPGSYVDISSCDPTSQMVEGTFEITLTMLNDNWDRDTVTITNGEFKNVSYIFQN